MDFKGILFLSLVTEPELKTLKSNNGGTVEFWELTLTDRKVTFNRVSGDKNFDFSKLEAGKTYPFAIVPRVKNIQAVANNGNQYNKAYNDFKIMGVASNEDIKKLLADNLK